MDSRPVIRKFVGLLQILGEVLRIIHASFNWRTSSSQIQLIGKGFRFGAGEW
jgi:hypothetical protein